MFPETQKEDEVKPPMFRYPGGKASLAKWIISHFPTIEPGTTFHDTFAGRGNVYFALRYMPDSRPFSHFFLNDHKTAPFFHLLQRMKPEDIPETCGRLTITLEELKEIAETSLRNTDRGILIEPYVTYSGAGYGNGPSGAGFKEGSPEGYIRNLQNASRILKSKTTVTSFDSVMKISAAGRKDFHYVDPPYPDCDAGAYEAEDYDWHAYLCRTLRRASCRWILSNYARPPYTTMLGPPKATKETNVKMSDDTIGESRTECLWWNY